jgi:methionyl-tRNA formyltransferase
MERPMIDTVILLTEEIEQPALASELRRHNPHLTILPVSSSAELAAMEPAMLRQARLIAFTTDVIVPQDTLRQLGYGAYNFHPGPPQYPGWSPAHFALYDQADRFGATLHVMVERVDAGSIVDVEMFAIPAEISVDGLEELAYARLTQMFWRSAKLLATCAEPLGELPIQWSRKKSSKRRYQAICDIPLTISKEELERRIKIFGACHHGVAPTINLHGIQFRAVLPDHAPTLENVEVG